jgi:H+/gluconate symporter-like permease
LIIYDSNSTATLLPSNSATPPTQPPISVPGALAAHPGIEIGIALGIVVVLISSIVASYYYCKKRRIKRAKEPETVARVKEGA